MHSNGHIEVVKILKPNEKVVGCKYCRTKCSTALSETCRVVRTAYYIAKNDKPYTNHLTIIELQELKGVNLGRV